MGQPYAFSRAIRWVRLGALPGRRERLGSGRGGTVEALRLYATDIRSHKHSYTDRNKDQHGCSYTDTCCDFDRCS